jgi:ADP-heptose:LPS heptosyltransferase
MADCRKSFFQNLCGRTSLTELDQEIQGLDLLLCSDSGAMHLANFRGTPVFAIFGPTSPNITGPIFEAPNSIAEVSSKNFRRVSELDLKEMSEKLESFLKKEILTRCK